ncbi:hypothetical protein SH661x_001460 [Planctomicrobium sp. SH661]|uniref:hypothetical protein n=1 Tax=Planctomicrobium sp. SH661 TaxID=3448124 RepID=UPI003F5BFE38
MQFHGRKRALPQIFILTICLGLSGCPAPNSEQPQPPVPAAPAEAPPASASAEDQNPPPPESSDSSLDSSEPVTEIEIPPLAIPPEVPSSLPPPAEAAARPGLSAAEKATILNRANRLLGSAKLKRGEGKNSTAFREAREAWNLVEGSKDPDFQRLAGEIRAELDASARQLSASKKDPPSKFRTLILE